MAENKDNDKVLDSRSTEEKIAAEIAKCIVYANLEGPFDTCVISTDGRNMSIGVSCWEGGRADNLLNQIGLSKHAGKMWADLTEADKTEIKTTLASDKGKQVQLAILTDDAKNYVSEIKSSIPSISDAKAMIYIGSWCPTSTYCAVRHAAKNVSAVSSLDSINQWFIGDNNYAIHTADVPQSVWEGYVNRGNKASNYLKNVKDSDIGKLDLATLKALQNYDSSTSLLGGLASLMTSAANSRVRVLKTIPHGKHADTIFGSPSKLYCEPVYPDYVTVNAEPPGIINEQIIDQASESEITEKGNLSYDIPQETAIKHGGTGYATAALVNELVDQQKKETFDLDKFSACYKIPTGGKPVNDKDPFPVDSKIEEFEKHKPRCKIDTIKTCPEAANVAKACIQLSCTTERRLVRLENNIATMMRYLHRLAARVPINCMYYGGASIYERYKCIRCLKDNRIEDGQLMTLDQCLNCTRFEPVIGQVYDILNEEGLNLAEVLDECQLSYTTPEEYVKFADKTKRQDKIQPENKSAALNVSSVKIRNTKDAAEDFERAWTPDMGLVMKWTLVPVEDQKPMVNGPTETLESDSDTFTNSGTPMAGQVKENIITRQKPLMDALTEGALGYTIVQSAKDWVNTNGDALSNDMNDYLYKNISELLKTKNSSFDVLLIAAISCSIGKPADYVIEGLENIASKLKAKGVTSELLIAQLFGLETEYLLGTKGDATDTAFYYRLDKIVYKIVNQATTQESDGGDSTTNRVKITPEISWATVNEWNWTDYIERLNMNIKKTEEETMELDKCLEVLPKIVYLYCLFIEKCNLSRYDDLVHGYVFPFVEADLPKIYYSSDFNNQRSYGIHSAIDLAGNVGIDIHAVSDGTIIHTESGSGAGNAIAIKHTDGMVSIYCHMQALEHQQGEQVTKGQVIGHIGYTGHCEPSGPDGAHLHFSLNTALTGSFRQNAINPASYFTKLNGMLHQNLA